MEGGGNVGLGRTREVFSYLEKEDVGLMNGNLENFAKAHAKHP
jgi:hypothetical protein